MRKLAALLVAVVLTAAASRAAVKLPPLVEAAKAGNREAVKALLQKGANPNDADGDGTSALHWASYRNDLETTDLLLKAGAKANTKSDLGVTALWTASQNGGDAIVKRLLQAGADPNIALLSGETPLMIASRGGYAGVAEQLVAKGANVNARGTRGQTALMWAAAQKHPEVVKVLVAHKADVHAKSDTYDEIMAIQPPTAEGNRRVIPHGGETALMFAARSGDAASAKILLDTGANPNDTDAWGVSATTLAMHSNFGDVAMVLLDRGADPNAEKAGMAAIHNAIMYRNEKVVAALLAHGANPNLTLKNWTPERRTADDLHYAREVVGASPLWLAARNLSPAIMKMLLDKGADPKFIQRGEHYTQGGDFANVHHETISSVVMAALGIGGGAAWIDLPTGAEKEALTLEAVKLAALPGVNLNLANSDGKTALDAATTAKYPGVIKLLTDLGAKAGTPATGGRGRGARGQ